MICAAFQEALTDHRIRGAPQALYFYLHTQLSFLEYRALKLWPVARALHMKAPTAGRAMKRLVECGYIREGPRSKPGGRSYALNPSRHEALRRAG